MDADEFDRIVTEKDQRMAELHQIINMQQMEIEELEDTVSKLRDKIKSLRRELKDGKDECGQTEGSEAGEPDAGAESA